MKKLGIGIGDGRPPIHLTHPDIPPRVSIFFKAGVQKTIVTEKTPRNIEESLGGDINKTPEIMTETPWRILDVLVNGKTNL